jgi:hypothetical protein
VETQPHRLGRTADLRQQTSDSRLSRQVKTACTTGSIMPSLVSLVAEGLWDECHAMLDRGKGDVNERNKVRSALITRARLVAALKPWVQCKSCPRLLDLRPPDALARQRLARHPSPHPVLTSSMCDTHLLSPKVILPPSLSPSPSLLLTASYTTLAYTTLAVAVLNSQYPRRKRIARFSLPPTPCRPSALRGPCQSLLSTLAIPVPQDHFRSPAAAPPHEGP